MKIIDRINEFAEQGKPFYSFEFFPPKTESGLANLYDRIDRLATLEPAFVDITWGAGGSTHDLSLEMSRNIQQYFGLEVMMHLTCTGLSRVQIATVLNEVKQAGVTNLMALRGDAPQGQENWEAHTDGFRYGSDLTQFVRETHGDYFGIGVGAYPEGHEESANLEQDVYYTKVKVDAGADFIVTQLFYDMDAYFAFVESCRAAGITCPIIPGIMPIHNYQRFVRFTSFTGIHVPKKILATLEEIKNDDAKVQDYGVDLCVEMCEELLRRGSPGLHFYTLNLETSVSRCLERLDFAKDCRSRRRLPWRQTHTPSRSTEDVRPIFWSNRPKSYLARTAGWDDFPNGRWGDSRSPTFGGLSDYYLLRRGIGLKSDNDRLKELWGTPQSEADIAEVFVAFCEGRIDRLPWCEVPVQMETTAITPQLVKLNRAGLFTINSQPQVNGSSSSDPVFGWGQEGGFVYQKAYLEFFAKPSVVEALHSADPGSLSFCAVKKDGTTVANSQDCGVNAVTWGVFPNSEIVQPTVVDKESFLIWKDEAFQLWLDQWCSLYDEGSDSHSLISDVCESYYLVNIVENDYKEGDLFSKLASILKLD